MARIRTIKPEFFTSEDIVSLTPLARVFYIALWCEADREGRMDWKPGTLKMRYLPGDNCDVMELAGELIQAGLIVLYEVDCKRYAEIPTFKTHQVINNRESESTRPARVNDASKRVKAEGKEGKEGREGEGEGRVAKIADAIVGPCPQQQIIDLYHRILPMGRVVREWTPARGQALRTRWRESAKRQQLEWWEKFFRYVSESRFLTGQASSHDRRPFEVSLDWLVKSENMAKVIEGAYHEAATETN
jgi:hypothetical protein